MNKAEIFVSKENDAYKVKVSGRATFAVGPTLRNLVRRIESDLPKNGITINLSECTGMDSTFMGILAMLALKLKNENITVQIANASEANKRLFDGLGLNKLFDYISINGNSNQEWIKEEDKDSSFRENAETVLEAHKSLVETDTGNIDKFKNVIEQVEKDIEKL